MHYEDNRERILNMMSDTFNDSTNVDDTIEEDNVNSPSHYTAGAIETIDYIIDVLGKYEAINYCHGNVIKYTGKRLWNKGNPTEDCKKAIWYMNKMVELMEETKGVNW